MEQAILASENESIKRIFVFLTLNILGVVSCIFVTTVLALWALNFIFPEPNTAPVIQDFIYQLRNRTDKAFEMADYDFLLELDN
ncbi:hypothetical protein KGM_204375 [Danaus plexippus plexippus]|uniref:Uncharacterized protein n=1 Tax=Danaus plexippus plexippus TaxID=278856 RepID=A0A212F4E2_DANPL|nr:hypothetical protein KGM_204375 [Danaus plexippus plexippus]